MTDVIQLLASQYQMRGAVADLSDIIRDSMAHRSNMLASNPPSYSTASFSQKAMMLYDDWETDVPSYWPEGVKKRLGIPHVFHSKLGKWVPTHSFFQFIPDIYDWIFVNATTSSNDREELLGSWIAQTRSIRVKSPYSYYPIKEALVFSPASIIIRNIGAGVLDSDLLMAFSVFGPVIDLHHPPHFINKKKSFFVFIEFYNSHAIDLLFSQINGTSQTDEEAVLYFKGSAITIQRAGTRKTSDFMKSKASSK